MIDHISDLKLMYRTLRGKVGFEKCEAFKEWIQGKPCCICDYPAPSVVHHCFQSYGSKKTTDFATVPLCAHCHDKVHRDDNLRILLIEESYLLLIEWAGL